MSEFENLSEEELEEKKEWYEANGWDSNAEAAAEELSSRQEGEISEAQLSNPTSAEEKAEVLYRFLQEAGEYGDAGDKDRYYSMLEEIDDTLKQMSGEVNQIYAEKVNGDWE